MRQALRFTGLGVVTFAALGFAARSEAPSFAPGVVTDLTVTAVTDSQATLVWTEVPSGLATPATYDLRYGLASGFAWWLVKCPTAGGCQIAGTSSVGGMRLSTVVRGLKPSTAYTFQTTAYTGTLNVNAVFSPSISNTATATTAATPPPPPPPPPPPVPVATTVTINQSVVEQVGQRMPLIATVRDQFGMVQPFGVVWSSRNTNVAVVDTNGVVQGIAPGIDTITAISGRAQGHTIATIQAVPAPPPLAMALVQAIGLSGIGIPMLSGTYRGTFSDSIGVTMDWTLTVTSRR